MVTKQCLLKWYIMWNVHASNKRKCTDSSSRPSQAMLVSNERGR